jgi:protein-tyrosine phosphatase
MPLTPRARELSRRLDAVRAYRSPAASDDIADPIRQRPAVHEEVARTIAAALRPLADILFTSVRDQPALRVPA